MKKYWQVLLRVSFASELLHLITAPIIAGILSNFEGFSWLLKQAYWLVQALFGQYYLCIRKAHRAFYDSLILDLALKLPGRWKWGQRRTLLHAFCRDYCDKTIADSTGTRTAWSPNKISIIRRRNLVSKWFILQMKKMRWKWGLTSRDSDVVCGPSSFPLTQISGHTRQRCK